MKWFKHYSNASTSQKLTELFEEMGHEGNSMYWLLLEVLASEFEKDDEEIKVHKNQIKEKLRIKFDKKLVKVMQKFREFSLTFYRLSGNFYFFEPSILLDLQSKDFKYSRSKRKTTENKIKDIKIKDIKIKNKQKVSLISEAANFSINPDKIIQIYNEVLAGTGNLQHARFGATQKVRMLFSADAHQKPTDLLKSEDEWKVYFQKIKSIKSLTGQHEDFNIKTSLYWFMKPDNISEIFEGKYDEVTTGSERPLTEEEYQRRLHARTI